MERGIREIWQGVRRPRQSPVFVGTVGLVIVVTIAVAASVSSLATAVLFRALPYPDAGQLVRVNELSLAQGIPEMPPSLASVRLWREQGTIFEDFGVAHAPLNLTLETDDGVARLLGGLVSPEMFATLGVRPALGRPFDPQDGTVGSAAQSVMLSHEAWTRVFGRDEMIIGRAVTINGFQWVVIGVLPDAAPLLPTSSETIDAWLPLGQAPLLLGRDVSNEPTFRAFPMIARLRPGVSAERVEEELRVVGTRLAELHPGTNRDWSWEVRPLSTVVTRDLRGPVAAMLVGAALLLLVGVVNVHGLFVQRARQAARWAAVCVALGASRRDLIRNATIEATLVWLPATAVGIALAAVAIRTRDAWMPFPLPPHLAVGLDPGPIVGLLSISVGVAVLTGWATGSWWWRQATRNVLGASRTTADPRTVRALRAGLAVQVALAAVLTVTGLLTFSSISRLASADVGIRTDDLLTVRVDVPAELRPDDQVHPTARSILTALRDLPTTADAAFWAPHVPAEAVWHTSIRVFDRPDLRQDGQLPVVRIHQIGAGAATLLGLQFTEGRDMTDGDRISGRRVALVSETTAREWWGDESAIDRKIQRWNHDAWSTVVGVVRDAPLAGRQGEGANTFRDVFFLHAQDAQRPLVFLISTRGDRETAIGATRAAVERAAADLPIYAVRFMDTVIRDQEEIGRSTARLGGAFAVVALALVAVGLYGLLANLVTHRAMEISLRKALGATTIRILREVTAPMAAIFLVGGSAGLAIAWLGLPGLMAGVLYEVGAREPVTYVVALAILVAPTAPALLGPALKGASRSPAGILRHGG